MAELRADDFADVPCQPGAYVVYRPSTAEPVFVHPSPAGWFKGEDPTVPVERLRSEWVDGAHVVYIGKADFRSRRKTVEALGERLEEFARFGAGENVGHRGGRLIWQLDDAVHAARRLDTGAGVQDSDCHRCGATGEVDALRADEEPVPSNDCLPLERGGPLR